ncbi:MAG TPA: histidine phosphatase family protein [Solirubrobacteraceae bacterium]|nr:histidine phosphatase family protein [Solirubrobacteraceae bacterium]
MRRLILVRHAPTTATRSFALPADEPLDEAGRDAAIAFGRWARTWSGETLSSPLVRCRQTAAAAGLPTVRVTAELAECDFGGWAGRTLAEICADDPAACRAWMTDPLVGPPGGECLDEFSTRIGGWLDDQARRDGDALAITHGGVVKAAVIHVLGAPLDAFWRVEVTPLAITELHSHDGRWTLARVNDHGPPGDGWLSCS